MHSDEAPITITEAAAAAILARADKDGKAGQSLRVRIRGGGCSGVTYDMSWVEGSRADDDLVTTQHGATLVVDPRSVPFLDGSTLDYERTLMKQRFVWSNPNAKGSCGCGESFAI